MATTAAPVEIPTTTTVEAARLIDWLATAADPERAVRDLRYLAGLANTALHHAQGRQVDQWRADEEIERALGL